MIRDDIKYDTAHMIGQTKLIELMSEIIDNKAFPKFVILVGPSGGGKKTMCTKIAEKLNILPVYTTIDVATVRETIYEASRNISPSLYIFSDGDTMSLAAKNALLKVTEEPPANAYFILTLSDLSNTLPTIRSRGVVFYLDPYSVTEISQYYDFVYEHTDIDSSGNAPNAAEREIVTNLCTTPGEVQELIATGPTALYSYADKVMENISLVSASNSFKLAGKIKLSEKDGKDKFDLALFWKAFMLLCTTRLRHNPYKFATAIKITSKYLQDLRIVGINKASCLDMWILEIREVWKEWN